MSPAASRCAIRASETDPTTAINDPRVRDGCRYKQEGRAEARHSEADRRQPIKPMADSFPASARRSALRCWGGPVGGGDARQRTFLLSNCLPECYGGQFESRIVVRDATGGKSSAELAFFALRRAIRV